MKKIIIILLALFISGCNIIDVCRDSYYDSKFLDHLENIELFYIDADINSLEDVGTFMRQHVVYQADGEDIWATPKETFKRGYGDCEDLTLLFINMTYIHLGLKFDLVAVDSNDRQIIEGGYINHAEPYYDGESYSVWMARPIDQVEIKFLYCFDTIFGSPPAR